MQDWFGKEGDIARASADAHKSRYVDSTPGDRRRMAIELLSEAPVFLYGIADERFRLPEPV